MSRVNCGVAFLAVSVRTYLLAFSLFCIMQAVAAGVAGVDVSVVVVAAAVAVGSGAMWWASSRSLSWRWRLSTHRPQSLSSQPRWSSA